MAKLTGVVPPVCTPLTADLEVDVDSLQRTLDHLITNGVDGVFVLGSSSEVVYLTDAQRRVVLETAVAHVAGRVPVLAGVIDTTTARVIEQARAAKEFGADAIVVTAPFYTRTSGLEIERHFRFVREAVDIDIWAYDIPVCVHSKLDRAMIMRLAADGVIVGLKDSSGDDANLRYLIQAVKGDDRFANFSILTGSELLVDTILWAGADGVVPGLGNVDPAGYVRLFKAAREGKWEEARDEQERLLALFELVNVGPEDRMSRNSSAIGAFKAGMMLQGVIDTHLTALPQVPLNDAEVAAVAGHLEAAGLEKKK
ncbi:dihydrodipicolinate synthase family protein [Micrococcales bacterium 31B]|nr:dihydrodipicolinate synthase family protein [Micrococcales bacterium 31B]